MAILTTWRSAARILRGRWLALRLGMVGSALVACVAAAATSDSGATQPTREYELKAAFVANFLVYVTWPDSAFEDSDSPLVIGVLDDDPFGPVLDRVVSARSVGGRQVIVRRHAALAAPDDCHVLFFPSSLRSPGPVLHTVCGHPVLTIGEQPGFLQQGGVISFVTDHRKLRFEINTRCIRDSGLRVSSQLLKLARVVDDPGTSGGE